jgi:hypothetical protein
MQMNTQISFCFHFFLIFLPVSQIASFNFFPPTVTCFTLKSTPAKNLQEINTNTNPNYTGKRRGMLSSPMVGERSSKVLEVKLKMSVLFPTPESPISNNLNR